MEIAAGIAGLLGIQVAAFFVSYFIGVYVLNRFAWVSLVSKSRNKDIQMPKKGYSDLWITEWLKEDYSPQGVRCLMCPLFFDYRRYGFSPTQFSTYEDLLSHLTRHVMANHDVPPHLLNPDTYAGMFPDTEETTA